MDQAQKDAIAALHGKGDYITTLVGRIYYEIEGSGPPVLIVPGGPGASHTHYHPWFSALADKHTVIYFDPLGTGASDRLNGDTKYSVQGYAADIEILRQGLGFEKISLIGLSFGSLPALEYAIRNPAHVSHLVMSDGHLNADTWQQGNIDNVNHEIQLLFPAVWEKIIALRDQGVLSGDDRYQELSGDVLPSLNWVDPQHPKLYRTGDAGDEPSVRVYSDFMGDDPEWTITGTLLGYDPTPELTDFRIPTLILTGRFDRVTPPAIAYKILNALPDGVGRMVTFERSAHYPWVEEADAYFGVVGEFLG
jgi:proline iminopeptidase